VGGVLAITAATLAEIDIPPVEQAIGNVGGFAHRGAA
jgi:hypothetical protein